MAGFKKLVAGSNSEATQDTASALQVEPVQLDYDELMAQCVNYVASNFLATVSQGTASSLQCEPNQSAAADLQMEPVQPDFADLNAQCVNYTASNFLATVSQATAASLQMEPMQDTATDLQMEPVQSDQTELNAQTFSVGPLDRRKFITAPTEVAISSTTATSAHLANGQWQMNSTIDTWVLQGGSAITATTSSVFLPAGETFPFYVEGDDSDYCAGITDAGTGTLSLTPLE